MSRQSISKVQLVNSYMTSLNKLGILQVVCEDTKLKNQNLTLNSKEVAHFASCGYLNLEQDERLIKGAIDAIENYGIQFSCSRAYMSLPLYNEFEYLLSELFGNPALVSPTSTLGHIANIPFLVSSKDVILMDHQVHNSVQNAVRIAKSKGTHVELIRHNQMDKLESKILDLKDKYDKIWYMADGVYSMFGDFTPIKALESLMNKYDQFYIYVDDAHGMSWTGENGRGYILNEINLHDKMVLVTSLCKGFGSGGGVTVMKDKEQIKNIRNCGSTHIFSGPLQPPILGASIASTKIHLTSEIYDLQKEVNDNIAYFRKTAQELSVPLISAPESPIQYVLLKEDTRTITICKELVDNGFFTSVAGYPSVAQNSCGVRITINRKHTKLQIKNLLVTIQSLLNKYSTD